MLESKSFRNKQLHCIVGQVSKKTAMLAIVNYFYSLNSVENILAYYEITYSGFYEKQEEVLEKFLRYVLEEKKVTGFRIDFNKVQS